MKILGTLFEIFGVVFGLIFLTPLRHLIFIGHAVIVLYVVTLWNIHLMVWNGEFLWASCYAWVIYANIRISMAVSDYVEELKWKHIQ